MKNRKTLILDENWNWRRCGAVLDVLPGLRGNGPDGQMTLVTDTVDVKWKFFTETQQRQATKSAEFGGFWFEP